MVLFVTHFVVDILHENSNKLNINTLRNGSRIAYFRPLGNFFEIESAF